MRKSVFFILFILVALSNQGQTIISTDASEYRNTKLIFYTFSDGITHKKDTLLEVVTDNKGAFDGEVEIKTIQKIVVDLGIYQSYFYASPHQKYQLHLPPKKEKTIVDSLNIFFRSTPVFLGIKNIQSNDLNNLIHSFDDIYDEFLSKNYDSIFKKRSPIIINYFEEKINQYYASISNAYFQSYKKYKIAQLRFIGPNRDYRVITQKYYNGQDILYNNPAYMDLFNMMYDNFLSFYSITPDGARVRKDITLAKSIKKLEVSVLQNISIADSSFAELVILKGIYDAFWKKSDLLYKAFPQSSLLMVLDSLKKTTTIPQHRKIAQNIRQEINTNILHFDNLNPNFSAIDINKDSVNIQDFKGKYTYIVFCRTDIVTCMEDMDLLRNLYHRHQKDIEIVSIFTDNSSKTFFKLNPKKYTWPLLYIGSNHKILKEYHVVTWPKYILLNPEGKIIMLQAPSPQENFESYIGRIINEKK